MCILPYIINSPMYLSIVSLITMVEGVILRDGLFGCNECSYTNSRLVNTKKHILTHHMELKKTRKVRVAKTSETSHPHKCIVCPFRSTQLEFLQNHAYKHKDSLYKCKHHGCYFSHTNFVVFYLHRSKFSHVASVVENLIDESSSDSDQSGTSDDSESESDSSESDDSD